MPMLRTIALVSIYSLPALASAAPLGTQTDPTAIYGGALAASCQWPSAVGLYGDQTQCTGSLVHPEIIVTAGHCLEGGTLHTATLGEDVYAPAYELAIASCERHPNYALDYPAYADFMFCRLAQPLVGVPIVPILMGCEADALVPGAPAVLAGYGLADDGQLEGLKRHVTTSVDGIEDSRVFFVGGTGHGTCSGDSGGPAYLQLADGSWRVFGTTTGGPDCGDWGQSELIHQFVPWIEATTGIDVTPCHDADGTWAPTAECGGFPADPEVAGTSWDSLCGGASFTAPSQTCGPAFGDEDEGDTGGDTGDDPAGDTGGGDSDDDDATDDGDPSAGDTGEENENDPLPPSITSTTALEEQGMASAGCAIAPMDRTALGALPWVVGGWLLRRRRSPVEAPRSTP